MNVKRELRGAILLRVRLGMRLLNAWAGNPPTLRLAERVEGKAVR